MLPVPCPIGVEQLRDLYCKELSTDSQIAKQVGATRRQVVGWRNRFGIETIDRNTRLQHKGLPPIEGKLKSLLIGSMLGDGRISTEHHYDECHADNQLEYLEWKVAIWGDLWVPNGIKPVIWKRGERKLLGYRFQTITHDSLIPYHQAFYPTGKGYKQPPHDLVGMVDDLALAIWHMDDGFAGHWPSISFGAQTPKALDTCREIFETFNLKPIWKPASEKVGNWEFRGDEQALGYLDIIKPYIPASMTYKLRCGFEVGKRYRIEQIVESDEFRTMVRDGIPIRQMARQLGIGATTIARWIKTLDLKYAGKRART